MKRRFSELWTLAQQDRKKTATLGVLLFVAIGMGVRAVVSSAGGPREAAAAARPSPSAGAGPRAQAPISVEDALAALQTPTPIPVLVELERDLFHSTWAVIGPGQIGAAGKSGAGSADIAGIAGDDSGERYLRIEKEASTLRLRSTLLGASPVAVIECPGSTRPRVARVGDDLDGFRVVAIQAHTVELEKEGVRILLEQARQTP